MGLGLENNLLLTLLAEALRENADGSKIEYGISKDINWDELILVARRHSVLPLLYPVCGGENEVCPEAVKHQIQKAAVSAARQSYRLLFLSKFLCAKLKEAGIPVVLLKGAVTSRFYPVPEYRKSGDVDILLTDSTRLMECCKVLCSCGCVKKEYQDALHHVTYTADGGIEVELHTFLAEPFDDRAVNRYLRNLVPECGNQTIETQVMGVRLPNLKDGYHAYELLLHMLQHFLRAGFGLKLLCDWVVFWNSEHPAKECEVYLQLVRESGMKGFSDMVTLACCEYLGLDVQKVSWMEFGRDYDTEVFMREILEAEEFGRSASDRMVVLRGNGFWDYVREFQHQMRLNFPRSSKYFLCWPMLWILTFVRFIKNNRKIRNVSTKDVFRKAAQRSKIIQQMKLWKC